MKINLINKNIYIILRVKNSKKNISVKKTEKPYKLRFHGSI